SRPSPNNSSADADSMTVELAAASSVSGTPVAQIQVMAAAAWSERQPAVPSPSMRIRCPQCGSYLREMAYAAGSFTVLACGPCGKSYRLNSTPRPASTRHEGGGVQLVLRLECR